VSAPEGSQYHPLAHPSIPLCVAVSFPKAFWRHYPKASQSHPSAVP